MFSHS